MGRAAAAFLSAGVWVFAACPAFAHHSMAAYEFFATTMEGTVQSFRHANPHCILVLKVAGGSIWHFEGDAPAMVDHAGFGPDTFRPGDRLKLQVQRLKNGRPGGFWSIRMVIMKNGRPFAGHQCATARDSCD
jgi:hypothetical protein